MGGKSSTQVDLTKQNLGVFLESHHEQTKEHIHSSNTINWSLTCVILILILLGGLSIAAKSYLRRRKLEKQILLNIQNKVTP